MAISTTDVRSLSLPAVTLGRRLKDGTPMDTDKGGAVYQTEAIKVPGGRVFVQFYADPAPVAAPATRAPAVPTCGVCGFQHAAPVTCRQAIAGASQAPSAPAPQVVSADGGTAQTGKAPRVRKPKAAPEAPQATQPAATTLAPPPAAPAPQVAPSAPHVNDILASLATTLGNVNARLAALETTKAA